MRAEVVDDAVASERVYRLLGARDRVPVAALATVHQGARGALRYGCGIGGQALQVGETLFTDAVQLPGRKVGVPGHVGHDLEGLGPVGDQGLGEDERVLTARIAVEV